MPALMRVMREVRLSRWGRLPCRDLSGLDVALHIAQSPTATSRRDVRNVS